MPIKLDDHLLADLGLDALPAGHRRMLLQAIYDELELRVGTTLMSQMTDKHRTEIVRLIDRGESDRASMLAWLDRNVPNYRETVNEEFERLCNEVSAQHEEITAASILYTE